MYAYVLVHRQNISGPKIKTDCLSKQSACNLIQYADQDWSLNFKLKRQKKNQTRQKTVKVNNGAVPGNLFIYLVMFLAIRTLVFLVDVLLLGILSF
jgi:hypothetical protein